MDGWMDGWLEVQTVAHCRCQLYFLMGSQHSLRWHWQSSGLPSASSVPTSSQRPSSVRPSISSLAPLWHSHSLPPPPPSSSPPHPHQRRCCLRFASASLSPQASRNACSPQKKWPTPSSVIHDTQFRPCRRANLNGNLSELFTICNCLDLLTRGETHFSMMSAPPPSNAAAAPAAIASEPACRSRRSSVGRRVGPSRRRRRGCA